MLPAGFAHPFPVPPGLGQRVFIMSFTILSACAPKPYLNRTDIIAIIENNNVCAVRQTHIDEQHHDAAEHGHFMEAEVLHILQTMLNAPDHSSQRNLYERICARHQRPVRDHGQSASSGSCCMGVCLQPEALLFTVSVCQAEILAGIEVLPDGLYAELFAARKHA
jgi:hypothetical protein